MNSLTGTGRNVLLQQLAAVEAHCKELEDGFIARITVLESRITELQAIGTQLVISRQTMRENIAKHLTMRGRNDLATEVRALKFEDPPEDIGIVLPGWTCRNCGGFTGDIKGATECRGCGAPRNDLKGVEDRCLKGVEGYPYLCHCSDCRRERGMPP